MIALDGLAVRGSAATITMAKASRLMVMATSALTRSKVCLDAFMFIVIPAVQRGFSLRIDDKRLPLPRGLAPSMVAVNCGQTVWSTRTGRASPYYVVVCEREFLSFMADDLYELGSPHFDGELKPAPAQLLADLRRFIEETELDGGYGRTPLSDSLATLLLTGLLRSFLSSDVARGPGPERSAGVRRACAFIRERFGEPLGVGDLARVACMSTSRFFSAFKKDTGRTPHEYLDGVRIQESMRLLEDSMSISAVCRAVGFSSLSGFEEAFQRQTGMSPTDYRGALRGSTRRPSPRLARPGERDYDRDAPGGVVRGPDPVTARSLRKTSHL